jgi:two-component sensor histidine kinase
LERPGDEFRLTVADDGAGLTEPLAGRHVGLRVVRLLAKQLSGRVETPAVEVGVTCLVTFPA